MLGYVIGFTWNAQLAIRKGIVDIAQMTGISLPSFMACYPRTRKAYRQHEAPNTLVF